MKTATPKKISQMTKKEKIRKWQLVINDPNWDGNKSANFLYKNYGDDELVQALSLVGQDIDSPEYDDGR